MTIVVCGDIQEDAENSSSHFGVTDPDLLDDLKKREEIVIRDVPLQWVHGESGVCAWLERNHHTLDESCLNAQKHQRMSIYPSPGRSS